MKMNEVRIFLSGPELRDLYVYGFSATEIAKLYGVSPPTITKRLRPEGVMKRRGQRAVTDAHRFWRRVQKSDGCWIWTGKLTDKGYGMFPLRDRSYRAHRAAWELERGAVPDGLYVLHSCHNPSCVRIDHLYLGTHQANMDDMKAAGRQAKGDFLGCRINSKLGWKGVARIFKLALAGVKQRRIAEEMDVSPALICNILKGKIWAA